MKTTALNARTFLYVLFFALLSFKKSASQICSVNAGVDKTICITQQPLILHGTVGNSQSSLPTHLWKKIAGPAAIFSDSTALTTSITGLTPGNYLFQLTSKCIDGLIAKDYVSITVLPEGPAAIAGIDQAVCFNDSIRLSGNIVSSPFSGTWTVDPIGGTFSPNARDPNAVFFGAPRPGIRKFTWTVSNGYCKKSDFILVNNAQPEMPVSAGLDDTLFCRGKCTVLRGSYPGYAPQSGLWTVVSGPNLPVFSDRSSPTSKVCGLVPGTYALRWTVSGSCASGSDDMILQVDNINMPPPTLGDQVYNNFCESSNVSSEVLTGAPLAPGDTATWAQVGGSTIATFYPNNHLSSVRVENLTGTFPYKFTYTHTSASGCTIVTLHTVYRSQLITGLTDPPDQRLACDSTSTSFNISFNKLSTISNSLVRKAVFISGPVDTGRIEMINSIPAGALRTDTWRVSNLETPGTYIYQLEYSNACGVVTQDIAINVSRTPGKVNAGSDIILPCQGIVVSPVGSADLPGNYTWFQVSGVSEAILTGAHTLIPDISGLSEGVYVFRLSNWAGNACPVKTDEMHVTVTALPPLAPAIGNDTLVCARNFRLSAPPPLLTETGTWSVTPSQGLSFYPDAATPDAYVSGLLPNAVYSFTWTISNVCGSASSTQIVRTTAMLGPPIPHAGTDSCVAEGTSTIVLAGNPALGADVQWTALTEGSTVSPGDAQEALATLTGGSGTYLFSYALSTPGCGVFIDTVQFTILTNIRIDAGTDIHICTDTINVSATLNASTLGNPTGNLAGTWRKIYGPGTPALTHPQSLETEVQGLQPGTYEFEYSFPFTALCGQIADTVRVYVSPPPSAANAGSDQTACSILPSTIITLSASTPTNGSGYWQVVSAPAGSPPAVLSDRYSAESEIRNLTNGSYTLRWTVSNGETCPSSSDEMILDISAAADAGIDMQVCNVANATIVGSANTSGTWSIVSALPGTAVAANSGNTAIITGLTTSTEPVVSTLMYSIPQVGACPASSDEMSITNYPIPSVADAGTDKILCFDQPTVTLRGNEPAVGTGSWYFISGPNRPIAGIADMQPADTLLRNLIAGIYVYEYRIKTGASCPASTSGVQIIKQAKAAAMADLRACNTSTVNLSGNVPPFGTGSWSYMNGPLPVGGVIFSNQQNPFTEVSGLIPGTYLFRWSLPGINNCIETEDEVQVIIDPPVTAINAGRDTAFCQGTVLPFAIGDQGLAGIHYSWTPALLLSQNGISQPLFLGTNNPGNYVYTLKASIGVCESFSTININVRPAPIANIEVTEGNCSAILNASFPGSAVNDPLYSWNFGDQHVPSFASGAGPHHFQAHSAAPSAIALNIISADGCYSSTTTNYTPLCVLPVTLTRFNAAWKNDFAQISWSVESAVGFSHFELERSSNRMDFSRVYQTPYLSNNADYRFDDKTILPLYQGDVFYRLKLVDHDGHFEYSEIKVLKLNPGEGDPVVFPNPFSNQLNISYRSTHASEHVEFILYDATGHVMRRHEKKLLRGIQTFNMKQLGNLPPGFYTLQILSGGTVISNHKIIKSIL